MCTRQLVVATFALLFAATSLPAAALAHKAAALSPDIEAKRALASELLDLSNVQEGVEGWKRGLQMQGAAGDCGCGGASKEVMLKFKSAMPLAVREEFNPAEIVGYLCNATAKALSASELKELVKFRHSALGQKISAAEKASQERAKSHTPAELQARLNTFRAKLAATSSRKALIQKIVTMQGGVRGYVDAMINISIGTAWGTAIANPDRPHLSNDEIVAAIEPMRGPMESQAAPVILAAYASLYEPLSDADLKMYLAELSKPLSQKFSDFSMTAFSASLRAQTIKVGIRLAKEIDSQGI